MVQSMNTKNRRNASVQVDYLVHIQEIKPWPPSQSLRSLRSVLIQWENGARHSGSTNTVVPSIGSIVGEGTIEFNESFRLPVTLQRDTSSRGKDEITFKKNCLEFNLYEPRRDKTQLLATAVIDLADYGVLKEPIIITSPMSSKRILTNSSQPVLCIKMQPVEKRRGSSSSRGDLSRVMSLDNGSGSLSSLMNEEYAEEAETASITDDDVSSQSSLANAGLSHHNESNGSEKMGNNHGGIRSENVRASRLQTEKLTASLDRMKLSSSPSSSMDFSSELCSPVNGHSPSLASPESSSISISNVDDPSRVKSLSHSSSGNKDVELKANGVEVQQEATGDMVASKKESNSENGLHLVASLDNDSETSDNLGSAGSGESMADEEDNDETQTTRSASSAGISYRDGSYGNYMENEIGGHPLEQKRHLLEDPQVGYSSQGDTGDSRLKGNIIRPDHLKHIKSVRSPSDSVRGNGTTLRNQISKMEELGSVGNALTRAGVLKVDEQIRSPKNINTVLGSKIQLLEDKIKMLEGELRETAAIEAALYSVAAEHGSSMSKVHAPARRLSRLYLHACRDQSQLRRATAARSAVSGLVLVAKACGHDVPRLTFWLSNSVALRAIVSQVIGNKELPLSSASSREMNSGEKGNKKIPSPLRWKELSPGKKENGQCLQDEYGDWDDPNTFTSALEKVEAWIFCRTVESIWWQTLTPHMQSAATKVIQRTLDSGSKKTLQKISSGDHDKENIAIDHWNGAFKDACERLCPVRAGGHDCGCLPMLTRLIMEQCVARLDVAMFNAILRESADEMPTDPVSDPITNPNILPIPAGISSFGAGAQLKTVIGNWSRWLSDLFGMDDDDMCDDGSDKMETDESAETSFKSFNLLNALSDLMMLPKDMLLSESIRKEVCPTFGAPLIKRVLDNFVIDEFCPDPIPEVVHEALNSEDDAEVQDSISTIPCLAAPPTYQPPSAASVTAIIGDCDCKSHLRRNGSSVLRKAYTSDDELDELNSPLAAIIREGLRSSTSPWRTSWKPKEQGSLSTIRYQLLRDIWINSE